MKTIVLTERNKDRFAEVAKGHKPMFVLYYATWCGHCQMLHPTWEKAKKALELQNGLLVGEVEYSNLSALPKGLQNIRGFPTLNVVKDGKVVAEYQGDRTYQSLVSFAMAHGATNAVKKPEPKVVKPKAKVVKKPKARKAN